MYIALCDDSPEELERMTGLLGRWQSERQKSLRYKIFHSAEDLLDSAEKESFTLYLLDVMMTGIDGITAAKEIRSFDRAANIVFLTCSSGFAYESYQVGALDYLLKPVQPEVLFAILDRLSDQECRPQDGLTLKAGSAMIRILFSQLAYVEVSGKHLYFNLADGSVREVFGSLRDYESRLLERPEFMRTHRSYIVNMLQAAEFSSAGIRTFAGKELPVSRLLYPQLQKDYVKLLFSESGE